MASDKTTFRRALRNRIAEALGISLIVERKIDDALVDVSAVCSWPVSEVLEPDTGRHVYSFVVRVLLPSDPAVGPTDDERADLLEEVAAGGRAAVPASPTSVVAGVDNVWTLDLEEVEYDLDRVSVDFTFSAEFGCGCC